jgi:hypothetical protein
MGEDLQLKEEYLEKKKERNKILGENDLYWNKSFYKKNILD